MIFSWEWSKAIVGSNTERYYGFYQIKHGFLTSRKSVVNIKKNFTCKIEAGLLSPVISRLCMFGLQNKMTYCISCSCKIIQRIELGYSLYAELMFRLTKIIVPFGIRTHTGLLCFLGDNTINYFTHVDGGQVGTPLPFNRRAHFRQQCRKTIVLICHSCLINTRIEKNERHLQTGKNFDHQIPLSKIKCWYSHNCSHFLKLAVPFELWCFSNSANTASHYFWLVYIAYNKDSLILCLLSL